MRKWLVTRQTDMEVNMGEWHTPARRLRGVHVNEAIDIKGPTMDKIHESLFFTVNDAADADALMEHLATTRPGTKWAKYKLEGYAQAPAGPVKKFSVTDEGILPV